LRRISLIKSLKKGEGGWYITKDFTNHVGNSVDLTFQPGKGNQVIPFTVDDPKSTKTLPILTMCKIQ